MWVSRTRHMIAASIMIGLPCLSLTFSAGSAISRFGANQPEAGMMIFSQPLNLFDIKSIFFVGLRVVFLIFSEKKAAKSGF